MIFGKIYMDGDDVVFETVKKAIPFWVYLAGPYVNDLGETVDSRFASIAQTSNVAISAEARATLREIVSYTNPKFITSLFEGDIAFCYNMRAREGDRGILSFAPNDGFALRMNKNGEVRLCYQNGFDIRALDDMKEFDNEFLKNLDLAEPFDEVKYAETHKND